MDNKQEFAGTLKHLHKHMLEVLDNRERINVCKINYDVKTRANCVHFFQWSPVKARHKPSAKKKLFVSLIHRIKETTEHLSTDLWQFNEDTTLTRQGYST